MIVYINHITWTYITFLCGLSSNKEIAEDITQETFFAGRCIKKTEFNGEFQYLYLVVCHCQKYLVEAKSKERNAMFRMRFFSRNWNGTARPLSQ